MPPICAHEGCNSGPCFNWSGEIKGMYCSKHKLSGMVDVRHKRCAHEGCTGRPSFNWSGETKGMYCSLHKLADMLDVVSKRCAHEGCNSRPSFNHPSETRGMYCVTHKLKDMVNVKNKRCAHEGCTSQPYFNLLGETKGMYCSLHKFKDMLDVVNKTCAHEGCNSRPSFNWSGETKGVYCGQHKLKDMVDVRSKRCAHEGCNSITPCFNLPGETRGMYCRTHKHADMLDVVNKTCAHEGCNIRSSFNWSSETNGMYCVTHKLDGMVNVVSKRCEHPDCDTHLHPTSYGLPGNAPTRCVHHKLEGMMRQPKRKCTADGCTAISTHGITQPERCEKHALPQDDNLVEMQCQMCYDSVRCPMVDILDAAGVCSVCAPLVSGKRPRLAKQREVQQFLDVSFGEQPYTSSDKTPLDVAACGGRERPDFLWDRPDRIVILEVDEDQHDTRPCECEQTRMMNISQALGCEKTVWIRYNPDSFKSPESRRWSTKAKRHAVLKQWLEWALTTSVEELPHTIAVVHLFFDGFAEGSVQPAQLL